MGLTRKATWEDPEEGGEGGSQLHGGGAFQAEGAAGAKVLRSGVPDTFEELHGIRSSFLVGRPQTAHWWASQSVEPTPATIASWGFSSI